MFSDNEIKNRLNLKTNCVQYICLTKALQKYMKLLNKQLTKHYNNDLVLQRHVQPPYIKAKKTYPKLKQNRCQKFN